MNRLIFAVLVSAATLTASAQRIMQGHAPQTPPLHNPANLAREMEQRRQKQAENQRIESERTILLAGMQRHPLRLVNGITNTMYADGWCRFAGKVLQVDKKGIRVEGTYSRIKNTNDWADFTGEFMVLRFPYEVAEAEEIYWTSCYLAKETSVFQYTTVMGASRTIRALDYGIPLPTATATNVVTTSQR